MKMISKSRTKLLNEAEGSYGSRWRLQKI